VDIKRNYITKDEFDLLLSSRAKTKRESGKSYIRYKAILMLMYHHGLRRSELQWLQWADINLTAKPPTIFCRRKKNGNSGTHPLAPGERAILMVLRELTRGGKYVIENPDGDMTSITSIDKFFQRLGKKNILPFKLTPHMLRHGCGYYLVNKGVGLRQIQDYLGHVNIANTVIYTKLDANKFVGFWENTA